MKWRRIPFAENTGAMNMGIDESILEHVSRGDSPPTIRFYAWRPSTVTIGNFQCRKDEVDVTKAKKLGVDVVRRLTGGGAVYHDQEITYSVIAPLDMFEKDILKSYEQICGYVVNALKEIGINAAFKPINDIMVNEKKISGSAQTRRKGVLLQHGTILFGVDVDKMFSLLKVDKEKVSDKFIQSVKKMVTSVKDESTAARRDLLDALVKAFPEGERENLTMSEKDLAITLSKKYSSEDWNNLRS